MSGLQKLLFRIIPIALLIMFISYGITIIFPINNLTYLQKIQTSTGYRYSFDWTSYMKAFTFEPLQVAFKDVFDINPFIEVLNAIGETWTNDYTPGDITITIGNLVILILDAIILIFNAFIGIARVVSGIILTLLSLLGININADLLIIKSFTMCAQIPNIPMVPAINVGIVNDFFSPVVTVPVVLPTTPVVIPPVIGS